VGGTEDRAQHAIRDHGPRRRQMAVHADVAGERAQVRAGVDDVNPQRDVGGGEAIGGAGAYRDVAVAEPGAHLGDAEPGELAANVCEALVERGRGDARVEHAHPRAPALEALGRRRAWIGAELGNLELEAKDVDGTDASIDEREPSHAALCVERERQPAYTGGGAL